MTAVALTAKYIRPLPHNGAVLQKHTAGGAITVGQVVALASDGYCDPADANGSQALSMGIGIAVASYDGETSIAAGDPVTVCVFGPVAGFTGMTPGANHYVSDTAGALDTAAGTFDRIVGYAISATEFFVNPQMNDPSSA